MWRRQWFFSDTKKTVLEIDSSTIDILVGWVSVRTAHCSSNTANILVLLHIYVVGYSERKWFGNLPLWQASWYGKADYYVEIGPYFRELCKSDWSLYINRAFKQLPFTQFKFRTLCWRELLLFLRSQIRHCTFKIQSSKLQLIKNIN